MKKDMIRVRSPQKHGTYIRGQMMNLRFDQEAEVKLTREITEKLANGQLEEVGKKSLPVPEPELPKQPVEEEKEEIAEEEEEEEQPAEEKEEEPAKEESEFHKLNGVCPKCKNKDREGEPYKRETDFNKHVKKCKE